MKFASSMCALSLNLGLIALMASGRAAGINENRLPAWIQVFLNHRSWTGVYFYRNRTYSCVLKVHSLIKDKVITASFEEEMNAVIDLEGFSYDDNVINFQSVTAFNGSEVFPKDTGIGLAGVLNKDMYGSYRYDANFTAPVDKGFRDLSIQTTRVEISSASSVSAQFNVGLAVGIPILLAVVVCVSATALILWAIRKGYLRHVPSNYRTFRGSTPEVSLDNPPGFDNPPGLSHI